MPGLPLAMHGLNVGLGPMRVNTSWPNMQLQRLTMPPAILATLDNSGPRVASRKSGHNSTISSTLALKGLSWRRIINILHIVAHDLLVTI